MESISSITTEECTKIKGIFCDIDDTITNKGKLLNIAYNSLWKAAKKGLKIVPVTGRPAGWVDHIARMWPVNAVVGENGAFYFWMEKGKLQKYFIQDRDTRYQNRKKLEIIKNEILKKVPGADTASDQNYRESDLAIDFCEDVVPLASESIQKIVKIFHNHKANAKVSSIHVNGWFGNFDKVSTCSLLMKNLWNESNKSDYENYIFCGDSPNDEPMFTKFPYCVGVANIKPWLSTMKAHPKYYTQKAGGEGFAEMIDIILKKRATDAQI